MVAYALSHLPGHSLVVSRLIACAAAMATHHCLSTSIAAREIVVPTLAACYTILPASAFIATAMAVPALPMAAFLMPTFVVPAILVAG